MNKVKSIFKEPLLHFILIGALLYVGYVKLNNYANREKNIIIVTNAEIELLEQSWQMKWNRPPTAQEKEGLIKNHIRDNVLHRSALEMGLQKQDAIIKMRLVQKLKYLGADLIQPPQPNEAELVRYFEENREQYKLPDFVTITHIFFDPDKRNETTLGDAEKAMKILENQDDPTSNISSFGDVFMLASYYPNRSKLELRKLFGSGFTESVFALEPGRWHGPVLSGYGTHLVFVHNHDSKELPEYTEVRDLVRENWMIQTKADLQQKYIDGLMARYQIIIED